MKNYKQAYGRYTRFTFPKIEECIFGDLESNYDGIIKRYPDLDIGRMWNELEEFLRNELDIAEQNNNDNVAIPLKEIIHWTEEKDAYSVALLLKLSWKQLEDIFTCNRCTVEMADFARYLRSSVE